MKKVLVATVVNDRAYGAIKDILDGYKVEKINGLKEFDSLERDDLNKKLKGYSAMIVRSDKVNKRILDAAADLKLVVRAGAGVNTIDIDYATDKNVFIENTPGKNSPDVAELVIMHVLNSYRHGHIADSSTRKGEFRKKELIGRRFSGRKIGLVGFGEVSKQVATKLKGWNIEITAYDPFVSDEIYERYGVKRAATLKECFDSDVVSIHVPLIEGEGGTRGVVNYDIISKMPKNGVLVNTARAEVVDESGLIKALKERDDLRYIMDVFHEGDGEGEKRILKEVGDSVASVSPHLGASTPEANVDACSSAAEHIKAFLETGEIINGINYIKVSELGQKYMELGRQVGMFASGMCDGLSEVKVTYKGEIPEGDQKAINGSILSGIFGRSDENVSPMNSLSIAKKKGIKIVTRREGSSRGYNNEIKVRIKDSCKEEKKFYASATLFADDKIRLVEIDDVKMEYDPLGYHLLLKHRNVPGVIGIIGKTLGEGNINIEGLKNESMNGEALTIARVEDPVGKEVIEKLKKSFSEYGVKVNYLREIEVK